MSDQLESAEACSSGFQSRAGPELSHALSGLARRAQIKLAGRQVLSQAHNSQIFGGAGENRTHE
jgi:hypothetical protein